MADNSVLLVTLIILSFFFGPYQIPSARDTLEPAMPFVRVIIHPLGYIAHSCSIWMTVLLAINRFVAVCYPFQSEHYLTLKMARIQVAVVILFSVLVNLPRFFVYSFYVERNNSTNSSRIWHRETSLMDNSSFTLYYINIFYSSIVLILPLLILVVFNFAIVRSIRESANRMRRNSANLKGANQEKNLTVVMIVIIVEFLLCHSLDRVFLVLKHFTPPSAILCPSAINYASHASNILININSATDFFIYVIFKKRFRKLLKKMCGSLRCCREKNKALIQSHRPSSCSQTSNDISKVGCLKQMELKTAQYRQLTTSNSFRVDRSPSDSVFLPNGIPAAPLISGSSRDGSLPVVLAADKNGRNL